MKKSMLIILGICSFVLLLFYRGMHIRAVYQEDYVMVVVEPDYLIELPETDFLLPESLSKSVTYSVITDSFTPLLSWYNRKGIIVSYGTTITQESLPVIHFFVEEYQRDYFDEDVSSWELVDFKNNVSLLSYSTETSFYYLMITDEKVIKTGWINQPFAESYTGFSEEIYNSIIETYEALSE